MKKLVITLLTILCPFALSFAQSEEVYTVQVDTSRINSVLYRIYNLAIEDNFSYDEYLVKKIAAQIRQDNNYKRETATKLLLNCLEEPYISNISYIFFVVVQTWDGRVLHLLIGINYENERPLLSDEACKKIIIEWEKEQIFPNWSNELGKMSFSFRVNKDEIQEVFNSVKAAKSNNTQDFTTSE